MSRPIFTAAYCPYSCLQLCGMASSLLGLAVMTGWLLNMPFLIRIEPDYDPMEASTAGMFFICGLSLMAFRRRRHMALGLAGMLLATAIVVFLKNMDGLRPIELIHNRAVAFMLISVAIAALGIGLEKGRLLKDESFAGELERRLALPENQMKKVQVQFTQTDTQLEIVISDAGTGFDPRPFMKIEPSRATQGSGRGIAKANLLSFDQLTYLGKGNYVQAITKLR